MARIRRLEVRNFRSIQCLDWHPSAGINCLVGPGDGGKSTILDAIDLCLGARRSAPFGDTDFFQLDVTQPILISVTLGGLLDPGGHFKFPHLWPLKLPQAGRSDYGLPDPV
jgi:hypothetical protein